MSSHPAAASATSLPKLRQPRSLNQGLSKRLLSYATVAGAGLAGCASRAAAEIVYTPTHADINFTYELDLNHDGIDDFRITSFYSFYSSAASVTVFPLGPGNHVAVVREACFYSPTGVAALPVGVVIGPALSFPLVNDTCMAVLHSNVYNGPWLFAKEKYLGLKFAIEGRTHYAWARLTVQDLFCYRCIARIQGYAYETEPDRPILSGDEGNAAEVSVEPGSLGALAAGRRPFGSSR